MTITQMAEAANQEIRTVGGQPYMRTKLSVEAQKIGWKLLKPYVAFRTIGSDTLTDLYRELRNGEDTFFTDVKEAIAFVEEHFNINEISRITKMLIERQRLDSNGADVLCSCIKSLKAEKNKDDASSSLDSLQSLFKSKK